MLEDRSHNSSEEEEKEKVIETQRKLSVQDKAMWERDEGISQLEGRIATNSFQG